ncbi:hypothetical protein VNI00_017751 [Paramarasmius palmivorus]|uniref:Uncharacterized protein n=1 Tax=Paramarasmius palmivorus TaxID=297713 RepID=A0AAW0B4E2_9AGAR
MASSKKSAAQASPAPGAWKDKAAWIQDTLREVGAAKDVVKSPSKGIRAAAVKDLMDHLRRPLNVHHVALDDEGYKLYGQALDLVEKLCAPGDLNPNVPQLLSLRNFKRTMDELREPPPPKPSKAKSRRPKSAPTVEDSDDADADDEVVEVVDHDVSTKTAETRAQTVSIPYLANPGIAAGSRAYLKAIHVLSKATPTASNSRKRARIEKPVADIREEDLDDRELRLQGHAQVNKYLNIIPFLDMSTMSREGLLSVGNYLRTEMATLQHTVAYYGAQYKLAATQFDELEAECNNRLRKQEKEAAAAEASASQSLIELEVGEGLQGMSLDTAETPAPEETAA